MVKTPEEPVTDLVPADLAAPGPTAEPDDAAADASLQALVEARVDPRHDHLNALMDK